MCTCACLSALLSVSLCVPVLVLGHEQRLQSNLLEEDALFPVFPVVVTSLMEDALQYHGSHFCPLHCDGAEVLTQPVFGSFSET